MPDYSVFIRFRDKYRYTLKMCVVLVAKVSKCHGHIDVGPRKLENSCLLVTLSWTWNSVTENT